MPSYAVTGASRGIGLEFIRQISAKSQNVVFALVRNAEGATDLRQLASERKNIQIVQLDMDDHKSIDAAAKHVSAINGGKLDMLINNGALMRQDRNSLTLDTFPDPDTLENDMVVTFKTNVVGVTHTINAFLPLIRAGDIKKIIVISSSMGSCQYMLQLSNTYAPIYCITKAAVNMVVAKYAVTLKEEGITLLAVNPGLINTSTLPKEVSEPLYNAIVARIRQVKPDYSGVVPVERSVSQQLALFDKITIAETGAFLNRDGTDGNELEI